MRGRLVGYSAESRTYRVKPYGSSRIMESAHVTFYEQLPQLGEIVTISEAEGSSDDTVVATISTERPPQQPMQQQSPQPQPALPAVPVVTPPQQQPAVPEHIRVSRELAEFLDTDLLAEGVVVDTPPPPQAPQQQQRQPSTVPQSSNAPSGIPVPPRRSNRVRSQNSDSLQNLGNN